MNGPLSLGSRAESAECAAALVAQIPSRQWLHSPNPPLGIWQAGLTKRRAYFPLVPRLRPLVEEMS
jgi:hypothetical protein